MAPPAPGELVLRPNVPHGGDLEARARDELSGYYAHIQATDRAIGRLLDALRRETVVVFTSVHGDMHGAHGLFRKGWPHEESIRVPLLVAAPFLTPGFNDTPVSLLDLPAMTIEWAEGGSGELANNDGRLISMPSVVELPHQCDRVWNGIRTRGRKLILNADGSPWLFFDLERDPFERENLVLDSARQTEIMELTARMKALAVRCRSGFMPR